MSKFVLVATWLFVVNCVCDIYSQTEVRTWQFGEKQIKGRIQSLENGIIDFRLDGGGSKNIPISDLSESDQRFLAESIYEIVEVEKQQLISVLKLMDSFMANSEETIEELRKLEGSPVRSPYASLMLGVARARQTGDHSKARRHFAQALKAIKTSRKLLGKDYHQTTVQSLLNNSGVCKIKQIKGDTAAKAFKESLDEGGLTFAIHHNSEVLFKTATVKYGVDLKSKPKRILYEILQQEPSDISGVKIPSRSGYFIYTLKWNSPLDVKQIGDLLVSNGLKPIPSIETNSESEESFEIAGLANSKTLTSLQRNLLFPDLWCTACKGKGQYECNGEHCQDGKVMKRTRQRTGTLPNGTPTYAWRWKVSHTCGTCSGGGEVNCRHCRAGKLPFLE